MKRLLSEAKRALEDRRNLLRNLKTKVETAEKALRAQQVSQGDWADRASEAGGSEVLTKLGEAEERELLLVDAALVRIDNGTYGVCLDCGGSIGRQRLRALPEAPYCLGCMVERGRTSGRAA